MPSDSFDRIEQGLGKLLEGYESLKAENDSLKNAIESKDLEIKTLSEKVKSLDREKALVKEKVDMLLGKLDSLIQGA